MASATGGISEIMVRLALISLAVVIILFGLIIFSTPLPFGSALILAGCGLLVSVSETAAMRLRRLRMDYPRLNKFFGSLEICVPGAPGCALRRTAPNLNGNCPGG